MLNVIYPRRPATGTLDRVRGLADDFAKMHGDRSCVPLPMDSRLRGNDKQGVIRPPRVIPAQAGIHAEYKRATNDVLNLVENAPTIALAHKRAGASNE